MSIPAISSGIFGFPKPLCAQVFFKVLAMYVAEVLKMEEDQRPSLQTVRMTNFDDETCEIFRAVFV